jgi:O-antigen/teichoic acid export membrane protein
LLNQAYGLWFFISSFLMTLIITRQVSTEQYGVYVVALTAFNTIQYLVAFGLEDATTTFVPRIWAEHGKADAASLIRRLLGLRLSVLVVGVLCMLYGLPLLAYIIALVPIPGTAAVAQGLRAPALLTHILPLAVYVLGSSAAGLLTAVCAALMRMTIVFVIGCATQLLLLGLSFYVLHLGWGIDGILWLLALVSLVNAAAFALWLAPQIFRRGVAYKPSFKPILQLGVSSWLTNLASGALFKQISVLLLNMFAVSLTGIAYFNLSFQLADSANTLLVAGFGGVGGAALATAFVGHNHERLGRSWQVLIKVETLLAVTGLVFCLFNAPNIAHVLYGSKYDPIGPLFTIFLFFNILVRILGTTIHQSALYVVGKARLVVLSQWAGLLVVLLLGILLVPLAGPAGALIADGVAKTVAGGLMLLFLLKDIPRKHLTELAGFTLRFLAALLFAALPSLLWHPTRPILLLVSAGLFLGLCIGFLCWLKPLNAGDWELLTHMNPRFARYFRWFVRKG